MRTDPKTIVQILHLLTEGTGIRATARLTKVHRDTVLRILKHAGQRSYQHLQNKLLNVPVKHVEADEIWTFVLKKSQMNTNPETDLNPWGDFYVFMAMESDSKVLFMPTVGKRSELKTELFARDIARGTAGRFQLTTDGFRPYKTAMTRELKGRVDFAQFYKEYDMLQANKKLVKYNAVMKDSQHRFAVRAGNPKPNRITTSHIERLNLSLRLYNRRFTRKCPCFSKDEEYLAYSVYLFAAHYNFCREHSALGKKTTPAMAAGISNCLWGVEDLLNHESEAV